MRISFIATVFNEESTIRFLLQSLSIQSKIPDEIIIVDGGSTDSTLSVISNFTHSASSGQEFQISNKNIKFKFFVKKGNRSVGRNEAIRQATGDIIVCSDAGCILDKNWVKNIIEQFNNPKIDVVSGYYKARTENPFEKCIAPYFLVMEDRIDEDNFLPATRSMAFKKSIWKKVDGFPEKFSNNEDYVFANKLKKIKAKIVFKKDAVAYWLPKKNIREAFVAFYRFALGDAESQILRPKVIMIFIRYAIGLFLVAIYVISKSYLILNTLYLVLFIYVLWAIIKNFKYVKLFSALYCLPLIQISSDIAVMLGTIKGLISFGKSNAK